MSVDVTVVIPHRGQGLGLWSTIHSCEEDLLYSKASSNFVIVTNGEKISVETNDIVSQLDKAGRLKAHIHSDEPMSPPVARQVGADAADGRLLCFFDNHCLVGRGYFDRLVFDFDQYGADMLHSTTKFFTGDQTCYNYKLKLGYNFWAENESFPQSTYKPYQIAAAGHGGFVVPKSTWDEVGGYGPNGLLVGYGGEEMIFDLKIWRYGKTNWIDPKLIHYHFSGVRGYSRHFSDAYYVNMMVSANVIGGQKWLDRVYNSFVTKSHIRTGKANMFDLYEIAYNRSAQYAQEVDAKSKFTLDELLVMFREKQIAM